MRQREHKYDTAPLAQMQLFGQLNPAVLQCASAVLGWTFQSDKRFNSPLFPEEIS